MSSIPSMPQSGLRRVIIVIPFGTPCSGKSFIWEVLRAKIESKEGWSCVSASTDHMRAAEMEKLMKGSNMTKEKAFEASQKTGTRLFAAR